MNTAVAPVVTSAKNKLRTALREMCVCGAIASALIMLNSPNPGSGFEPIWGFAVVAVICGPPIWGVYRLIRFIIGK